MLLTRRDWKWLDRMIGLVSRFLVSGTSVGAIDICFHQGSQPREIVVAVKVINGLSLTKVTC